MKRYELIWSVVQQIPKGRVATYGDIAALAGLEGHARQVGYALHNLPDDVKVPWHRVINAKGEISPRSAGDSHELQRLLLEAEGVELDRAGRVELGKYRWEASGVGRRASGVRREKPRKPEGRASGAGRRASGALREKPRKPEA